MNETTKRNFFEIMEIAQKYHNANMSGQEISEDETDRDALRVLELAQEIRRDNGHAGQQATTDALDARHSLVCLIADAARAYDADVNYSEIGAENSQEIDSYIFKTASVAI